MPAHKNILTYGTFDLFHIGHLRLIQRILKLGDKLIVGVSTDEFNAVKGKKCTMPFEHRADIVGSIKGVDLVIPEQSWEQKIKDIKKFNVDIFVMGDDWKGKFDYLKEYCDVIYLPRTEGISTTKIKKTLSSISPDLKQSLNSVIHQM
ncbi:glycerol-3-phosphate cytidylyltransferase [Acinetobacter gerneri]|uniref:glycerol-3-phosphate cytidylyltransferase n=1 Tax=Acinetobacter gerneri TaxID=202952 RepID=UPI003213DBDE